MEVIYICEQGRYPFGRGKQSQQTFLKHLIQAKDDDQINRYRQLNSILKKIDCSNIIRLEKVLKQDNKFHMIYQYHNKSLEQRLKQIQKQEQLADIFVGLEHVLQTLIHKKLKGQLSLKLMGVDQHCHLKVWIRPEQTQFVGNTEQSDREVQKYLVGFYEVQRARIHLEMELILQAQKLFTLSKNGKSKLIQRQNNAVNNLQVQTAKAKTQNFVIQGNMLVFLNSQGEGGNDCKNQLTRQNHKQEHLMSKPNHSVSNQRSSSKVQNNKKLASQTSATYHASVDLSKMSIAEKVLYYKKHKQIVNQNTGNQQNNLVVKDSSTSNVSQNDLSESSNNDSSIQIKTQIISKHKIKIVTSQEVQVQGNSDDDLQKLARQKIAMIQKERHQKSHNQNNSMQTGTKGNNSINSGYGEKYLKGLDQNSREQKVQQKDQYHSCQINNKIAQAKLKAKNILEKYGQKLKK